MSSRTAKAYYRKTALIVAVPIVVALSPFAPKTSCIFPVKVALAQQENFEYERKVCDGFPEDKISIRIEKNSVRFSQFLTTVGIDPSLLKLNYSRKDSKLMVTESFRSRNHEDEPKAEICNDIRGEISNLKKGKYAITFVYDEKRVTDKPKKKDLGSFEFEIK